MGGKSVGTNDTWIRLHPYRHNLTDPLLTASYHIPAPERPRRHAGTVRDPAMPGQGAPHTAAWMHRSSSCFGELTQGLTGYSLN